jgi:hypothetical protein
MRKEVFFILSPAFTGLMLFVVSQVDIVLFKRGILELRTFLAWEILLFLACLILMIAALGFSVKSVIQHKWQNATFSLLSIVVTCVFIVIAAINGAAFVNAT